MAGPWEKYGGEADGPWAKYGESAPAEKPSFMQSMGREALNSIPVQALFGAARGIGGIGATVGMQGAEGRQAVENKLVGMGANPESLSYQGGKLASEVGVTWPIGGLAAKGLSAIPGVAQAAPSLINALRTSGMTTGAAPANFLSKAGLADMAIRSGAGAAVGGASAGLVGDDAGTGAMIGGAAPGVFKAAGALGGAIGSVFSKIKNAVTGSNAAAGESLIAAMGGLSREEVKALADAAASMPNEIIPGSKLTFSQALELAGKSNPNVKLLERVVSQGPGGASLLTRYGEQAGARIAGLEGQGAQVYQGAAKEEANKAGNMIGARLRTQAGDEALSKRELWQAIEKRAKEEGVSLQMPIEQMQAAMSPLGRGSVISGSDARRVLKTAEDIGQIELPAINPTKAPKMGQSLEQAIRAQGGFKAKGDILSGEVQTLSKKESGTTGLVTKKGKSSDLIAEAMKERGFIKGDDPDELINLLRAGGGKNIYAPEMMGDDYYRAMSERAAGDLPGAEKQLVAVPYEEFQRLRRDSGSLAAKAAEKGDPTEAAVLGNFQRLLSGRVDDAASGNLLSGEAMSPGFRDFYNQGREVTKSFADRYKQSNNIGQVLRKPVGQDYTLNGDEIVNKFWHGGAGLQQDVANLKNVLNMENQGPVLDQLRKYVLTDAANKTTAGGNLAAAMPAYVENRMPGLRELLNPEQFSTLTNTAKDIRNATAAQNVAGLTGSATYANIQKAIGAGVLDSESSKTLAKILTFKGIGGESLRKSLAESSIKNKGSSLAELLSDPKLLQKAVNDSTPAARSKLLELLRQPEAQQLMYRMAPISQ